jgi:hypothetical protein
MGKARDDEQRDDRAVVGQGIHVAAMAAQCQLPRNQEAPGRYVR